MVYTDAQGTRGSSLRKNPKKLPVANTYNVVSVDTVSGTPLHIVKTWTVKAQV